VRGVILFQCWENIDVLRGETLIFKGFYLGDMQLSEAGAGGEGAKYCVAQLESAAALEIIPTVKCGEIRRFCSFRSDLALESAYFSTGYVVLWLPWVKRLKMLEKSGENRLWQRYLRSKSTTGPRGGRHRLARLLELA
jgi:hypothetical protein